MDKPLMLVIKDTYKVWANYMKSVAMESGIPDSYRLVLTFLLRNPGASQKELAEHCNITTSSISQTVKEMHLNGYIKKSPDESDMRFLRLYLTDKGEARALALRDKTRAADMRITELLTPEVENKITEAMKRLSDIIEKELPVC